MAAALLLFGAAPPTALAATPVPPRSVLEVNRMDDLQAASLPDGRAVVGWVNGTNSGDTTNAMVRPSGGLLPPTYQNLRRGYSSEGLGFLTGGPADSPVLTYFNDGDARTPVTVRLGGDTFGSQGNFFSGTYGTGRFPRFTRCPDGRVAFAFQYTYPGPPQSFATMATLRGPNGEYDPTIGVGSISGPTSPDYFQDPTVSCDRPGHMMFSYASDANFGVEPPNPTEVLGVRELLVTPGGTTGGTILTRNVPAGAGASAPDVRIAPDGRVWALWSEWSGGAGTTYVATRAPGVTGPLGPPTVLDATGSSVSGLFFGGGATHVLLAHEDPITGDSSYGIRTAAAGSATFAAEQPLLAAGDHWAQLIEDHPDGNPRLIIHTAGPAPAYRSRMAIMGIPQAGSTEPRQDLGFDVAGYTRAFTYLPSGDLFVVASDELAPQRVELKEGGLDTGAPPTLTDVSVPGLAAPGEPTALRVTARDPLGLSSFAWSVDGRSLPDQQATHTFTAPGTYVVTAKAVDRVGNAAELTRTVRVLDPAAVTPGSAEFAQAIAQAGGTLDRTAPKVTATATRRKTTKKGKTTLAKTVTVRVTSSEVAAADIELLGRARRGKDRGTLILKSARVRQLAAGKAHTLSVKIPRSLVRLVRGKLQVRVTLTDAAGNRAQSTVTVKTTAKK